MKKKLEEEVIRKILSAMSHTELDLLEDYKESISKSNTNGIYQAVWARRSDLLVESFKNDKEIEVLHIQRSSLWQIDPVLNTKSGVLYLMFSDKNLEKVRKDYIKRGVTTHYAYLFLQRSLARETIENTNVELIPFEETSEDMKENRNREICKMLGIFAEEFKDIVFVSTTYYDKMAIAATVKRFTPEFQLSEEYDVSDMLEIGYKGDSTLSIGIKGTNLDDNPSRLSLVTLKNTVKTNE